MVNRQLAQRLLDAAGWRARLDAPIPDRCVVLGEPHTSNWDGWYAVLGMGALGVDLRWMIKAEANKWPVGPLLHRLGAVFIERGKGGAVQTAIYQFAADPGPLRLALAPSGTRKRTDHWRTGFLRIARAAQVPLVLAYVDYGRREIGFGPTLDATLPDAELRQQMARFYAGKVACKPDQASTVDWSGATSTD